MKIVASARMIHRTNRGSNLCPPNGTLNWQWLKVMATLWHIELTVIPGHCDLSIFHLYNWIQHKFYNLYKVLSENIFQFGYSTCIFNAVK